MARLSPQNVYFMEDGQTKLTLDMPFPPGGSLQVFLNGILAVLSKDYIEVNGTEIEFLYQLSSTDVVITQQTTVTSQNIAVINESAKESLFKKYGTAQTLLPNQKYKFTLTHGDQEFVSTFYTILNPFYSTYEIISMDLGEITSAIPIDRIQLLIHNNSILAENIASEENMALLESEEKTPFVFKQYVRYRTEMDIMTSMYLLLSGQQGSVDKILGELEIKRTTSFVSDIKPILADLKKKLDEWEKALVGYQGRTIAASAVRGGSDSYPLYSPRREFATPPGAATSGSSE